MIHTIRFPGRGRIVIFLVLFAIFVAPATKAEGVQKKNAPMLLLRQMLTDRDGAVDKIGAWIQNNPELMRRLEKLQENEQVQQVLFDPDIQKMIGDGNYAKLLVHQKVRSLLKNEDVRSLAEEIIQSIVRTH